MIVNVNPTPTERLLLLIAGAFVFLNQALLIDALARPITDMWVAIAWGGCASIGHLQLKHKLPQRDPVLFPIMMLLVGWGLVAVDRLAPAFADRQAVWLMLGTALMIGLLRFTSQLHLLGHYRYHWLAIGIGLLGATLIIGVNPSGVGPRLWLGGGDWFFQPSEPLKLIVLVFLAGFLSEHISQLKQSIWQARLLGPSALILGLCLLILVLQRDLGTATIFYVVYILMLYVAIEQISILVAGIGFLVMTAYLGYLTLDIVALRIDIWLNPWPDAENRAYQIVQSMMAVSAGGLFGVGVGEGLPTFVPVAHTDFVFAAIAEEWGLLGVIALLISFGAIIYRSLGLALRIHATSAFLAFLAAGIGLLFAVQSLMIMGGIVRLWPLTGVALPFVSYGGSSLITSMTATTILLMISDRRE